MTEVNRILADLADFTQTARRSRRDAADKDKMDYGRFIPCSPTRNFNESACSNVLLPVWVPESSTIQSLQTARWLKNFYSGLDMRLASDIFNGTDNYSPKDVMPKRRRPPLHTLAAGQIVCTHRGKSRYSWCSENGCVAYKARVMMQWFQTLVKP